MAVQTTASGGLSGQYQKFFNPQLLDHAIDELTLNQFALKADFPKNKGAKIMTFVRQDVGLASNVNTLTEATVPTTYRDTTLTFIDATLVQYYELGRYSDLLQWTEIYNILKIQNQQFGEDAGLKADDISLTAIVPNVTGSSKRYSGGATTWPALAALPTNAAGALTAQDALDAFTQLADQKSPKIKGEYVMVISPRTQRDLMNDSKWILPGQYGTNDNLFKAEAGSLYGVRFVRTTNAWFEDGAAGAENTRVTTHGTKDIYANIALGRSAFGAPIMGGQSPFNPSIVVINKPDHSNPLNQYTTMGWKAYWASVLLNNAFVCIVRSRSGFA